MSVDVSPMPALKPRGPVDSIPTRWSAARGLMSSGRFRLYVSYACPWSHRVLIVRALNGLEDAIEVVDVEPEMDSVGWRLDGEHLADRYRAYAPRYAGKATVPLMVDVAAGEVVSNDSADLMRMLDTQLGGSGHQLFPPQYAEKCEAWNRDIQTNVNAAVYRGGLNASVQDKNLKTQALVKTLARLDDHFADHRYLIDQDLPLAPDWRLWTTLARYDLAYRPWMLSPGAPALAVFPNLTRVFHELLAVRGISATYRPAEITAHYAARIRDLKASVPKSFEGNNT